MVFQWFSPNLGLAFSVYKKKAGKKSKNEKESGEWE